jgi:ABC-type multidrug transport system ATPase subunit
MNWQTLTVSDLTAGYRGLPRLRRLSGIFERGAAYVVMGHNGIGKTTLLRALAGMLPVIQGQITPGLNTDDWRNGRGVAAAMPDDLGCYESLSTRDVVERLSRCRALSYEAAVGASREVLAELEAWIGKAGIGRKQSELSGGQRRMVATRLAMMHAPAVVLADEPFAGLDGARSGWVAELLSTHVARGGLVVVSHNGDCQSFPRAWRLFELRWDAADGRHCLVPRSILSTQREALP